MMTHAKGFVLLYILIVVAALTVSISLASALGSTFAGNRLRSYTQGAEVRMLAMRCAETLLLQVRTNTSLTGSGTITNTPGSCTYTISGTAPTKTITITAIQNNLYKRITIVTSQVTPVILSTWTEGA